MQKIYDQDGKFICFGPSDGEPAAQPASAHLIVTEQDLALCRSRQGTGEHAAAVDRLVLLRAGRATYPGSYIGAERADKATDLRTEFDAFDADVQRKMGGAFP